MAGASREFRSRDARLPRPGHEQAYQLDQLSPAAWPLEDPRPFHQLPDLDAGAWRKPRRSKPLLVDGRSTVYYWCLSCNRCLPHWRSAFCSIHRENYKRSHRRLRERTTAQVPVDRELLEELYDAAIGHLTAKAALRTAGRNDLPSMPERALAADRLRDLLSLIVHRVPDYL